MNAPRSPQLSTAFPRPGPALLGAMIAIFAVWLILGLGINIFGFLPPDTPELFYGSTRGVLRGEVWRLFTAPLMHLTTGNGAVSHMMWGVLGLYFLGNTLEARWGGARFLRFLIFSALIAYGLQLVLVLLWPSGFGKLVGAYWFGAFPIIEAIAVAWALSFRGQRVHLFFVLPVSGNVLLWMVLGLSVLRVVALSIQPEGLLSPFGGMLSGWLLGGGTPSPLRKLYLRFKLQRLEAEAQRERKGRKKRVQKSGLRVIEGGRTKPRDDDDDRDGNNGSNGRKGPDGRWLN